MSKNELLTSIITDLGSNYSHNDSNVLIDIYDEVIDNALRFSNRKKDTQDNYINILASEIRRATKTLYLSRGTEDVTTQTQGGIQSVYDNAMERMRKDIVANGKRVMR